MLVPSKVYLSNRDDGPLFVLHFAQLPLSGAGGNLECTGLFFHLIQLTADRVRFSPYLVELPLGKIGLPLGLIGERRDIPDSAFHIAGIAGDAVSSDGNDQHGDTDKTVNRVNGANLFPKRFIGWGFIAVGGGVLAVVWLWLLATSRRDLTIRQFGWRDLIAAGLLTIGLLIVWQNAPLALP